MKLHIMSDLHLEHHRDQGASFIASLPERKDTILILAGDITTLQQDWYAEKHLSGLANKYKHTFYVPGNHEFYGSTPQHGWTNLALVAGRIPNFTALTAGLPVELDGKRFHGDTLWFPDDISTQRWHKRQLTDFSIIKQFEPWVYLQHEDTKRKFEQKIQEGDIVITHHMPHPGSIHPAYHGDDLNRFFLGDCSDIIAANKPALWVHGHTHEAFDYQAGGTRIVCNPHGYPREMKNGAGFNENLIIEL